MKNKTNIIAIISMVLSIVCTVLCIVTLSVVLSAVDADSAGTDSNEQIVVQTDAPDISGGEEIVVTDTMLAPENGTDWHFTFVLENTTDSAITMQTIYIHDYMGGEELGCSELARDVFPNLGLVNNGNDLILAPGEMQPWDDWHPVVDHFDARSYRFVFTKENGEVIIYTFRFALSMEGAAQNVDYSGDAGRNLLTLRHDADFCVEVSDGVSWVPVNVLGKSDFSNADIFAMLSESPEYKQAQIDTLYEAMQLYQVGNFFASDDNIRMFENGVNWEHHKPGYDAVRTNNGCCATSANWLNYILEGDYDEVGYIATSQSDGSGHIFNYIRDGEWYYIIDMTHYRTDWIATAVETGDLNDYYNTDFIAGNIHRVKDIQDYVDYVQAMYNDPPAMMFMYTADNCMAVDGAHSQSGVSIIYGKPDDIVLNVIFDNPEDNVEVVFQPEPQQLPDWSN